MNSEFAELRQKVFDYVMKKNPVSATNMGIHEYDGSLPDGSRESVEEMISRYDEWIGDLNEIDREKLSQENRESLQAGRHLLNLRLFELEQLRFWASNPNQPQIIGSSLLPLLKRDFAPLETRLRSAISRIDGIPEFLEKGKELVVDPVELWVNISLDSLNKLPGLLAVIKQTAAESELSGEEIKELEAVIKKARKAFDDFKNWLEKKGGSARGDFAIGKEKFQALLEKQKLGYDIPEITELGKKYLDESRNEMEKYARRVNEDYSVRDAINKIERNTPKDFSKAITWYERAIKESRDYVERKNLATIPQNQDITVMETPSYLQHLIPFAAYMPPAKYDENREGAYMVTPPEEEEDLSRFAFWTIRNTTVHEGYPGHHHVIYVTLFGTAVGTYSVVWCRLLRHRMLING